MKKKTMFFCGLLATLFTSCETPVITDDGGDEDPQGNLKVSIYQIEQTPFSALTRAESGVACSRLNFAVYDEGGTKVKQINQTSDMASFGTAYFQVQPGTYRLVVVGHSIKKNLTMTDITKIQFANADGFTDTFLYSGDVEVNEDNVDFAVSLDRIVSLCRVVFTDDFPEDVTTLQFQYTGGSGAFNATTGFGCVKSTQRVVFDVTSGQKEFDLYTFLHDTEGTIHLKVTALDGGDNVICEREFDVPMKRNQITWLSGVFFTGGNSGSTGVTITINTDWAGESHVTF